MNQSILKPYIKPYLKDITYDFQKPDMQKSNSNSNSSKDNDEECITYSKIGNIKAMTYDKTGSVIKELFESLFYSHQITLETLSLLLLNCCTANAVKHILKVLDHIYILLIG